MSTGDANDLLERARAWAGEDPDPATAAELEALVAAGDTDELADRFSGTLEFGTAGSAVRSAPVPTG